MIQVDNDGKNITVSFAQGEKGKNFGVEMDVPTAIELAQSLVVHAAMLNQGKKLGEWKPGDQFIFNTRQPEQEESIPGPPPKTEGGFERFLAEVKCDMQDAHDGITLPENTVTKNDNKNSNKTKT